MKHVLLSILFLGVLPIESIGNAYNNIKEYKISVKYNGTNDSIQAPKDVKSFFQENMGIRSDEKFLCDKEYPERNGFRTEHFQQYYKGIKVDGGHCSFLYYNGKMRGVKGRYVQFDNLNPIPSFQQEKAIGEFLNYVGANPDMIKDVHVELLIKGIPLSRKNDDKSWHLVYKLFSDILSEICYIDAHNGNIVYTESPILSYATNGTFYTYYHGVVTGNTEYDNYSNEYILYDTTRGNGIRTQNGDNLYYEEIADNDNIWTSSEMGDYRMALDVHWTLGQIYDVLLNAYNYASYNGTNGIINAVVYHGSGASYSPAYSSLHFGIGSNVFNPMASVDVIAHEFGHAILHKTTGWNSYTIEESALHEGFADIWGVLFENRISPNSEIWKTGEDVIIGYDCERNFANPTASNAHTQIADTYGVDLGAISDSSDEHVVGGICPRWFYLLANGGSGYNGNGHYYKVLPLNFSVLEELFVQTVLTPYYLEDCTTFSDVRAALIETAEDFGHLFVANQMANAWYAVGVGNNGYSVSFSGPNVLSKSSTYSLLNLPVDHTVTWSLSGANAHCFSVQNNIPLSNQCTITRTNDIELCDSTNLTLTAQILYNGAVVCVMTKPLTVMCISGPSNPCSTGVYNVENLPNNYGLFWNLSGTGYSVITDFAPINSNSFGISRTSQNSYASAVVTATLLLGNNQVDTLRKHISSAANLTGTWYQTSSNFPLYDPNTPASELQCDEFIICDPNMTIFLQSDNFIGATMTCNNGNVSIHHLLNSSVAKFYTNPSNGHSFIVEGIKSGTCEVFRFKFLAIGDPEPEDPLLGISMTGREYVFSLGTKQGEENEKQASNSIGQWKLIIIHSETGQMVYEGVTVTNTIVVNTSGWRSGVYLAVASVNGKNIANKISVTK